MRHTAAKTRRESTRTPKSMCDMSESPERLSYSTSSPFLRQDIAFVPTVVIAQYRHQSRTPGRKVSGLNPGERARQIGIAVQDEEFISQQRQRLLEGATRAKQRAAVERVSDCEAKFAAVAHDRLYLPTQMTDAEHYAIDTVALQQLELMQYEGTSGDWQQ